MRPAIEVRAIGQRTRSGAVTLRDISLAVGHGELVAIIGGSGSGKTTLLDAMSGLRPPSAGSVRRGAASTGYVPAGETIHLELALDRALRYAAALRAVPEPGTVVDEVLPILDLAGRPTARVGELSGGERKRAAIAAELLAGPRVFFLDDPTAGLDPARGTELMRILRRLCDSGITVVLTTQNPLDADRCDKVAVLATGGHLVFYGTPGAARGYFGADSLDEIYERLAGLGDPAIAWSRRFFQFSRTIGGVSLVSAVPAQLGPANLVPDSAGPHSAGKVSIGPAGEAARLPGSPAPHPPAPHPPADARPAGGRRDGPPARALRPLRQWAVLTQRNADVLAGSRFPLAVLAGAPLAVLLTFLLLFPRGAFDPARPSPAATAMILFWAVIGGFFIGLGYGLLRICTESGVLRRERFNGLDAAAYVLAKAAVLLPLLVVADGAFLVVLRVVGLLPGDGAYGSAFVTLLLSSAAALGLGLLISAVVTKPAQAMIAVPVVCFPQVLFAGAILPVPAMAVAGQWISYLMTSRWAFEALGHSMGVRALWASGRSPLGPPLLASYGTMFDRPVWGDWLVLAGFTVAFFAVTVTAVARKARVRAAGETPAAGGYPGGPSVTSRPTGT